MVPSAMLAPRTFGASTERGQNAVHTRARLPGAAYRPLALAMRVTPARTAARAPLAPAAHTKTRKETTGAYRVPATPTWIILLRHLTPTVQTTPSHQREVTRKSTASANLATLVKTVRNARRAPRARTKRKREVAFAWSVQPTPSRQRQRHRQKHTAKIVRLTHSRYREVMTVQTVRASLATTQHMTAISAQPAQQGHTRKAPGPVVSCLARHVTQTPTRKTQQQIQRNCA